MTTRALKKRLRSKEAECIFHELLIADAAISPEMEEMARAAARSAVVEYEDAGVHERTGPDWRNSRVLRRAVIVFIVAAFFIFSGYLSMTPSGQALAASFTEIIMQIFDDGFQFSPAITPAPTEYPEGVTETMWELQDFQMASSMTGRKFLQIQSDAYRLDSLQLLESNVSGSNLFAFYETANGLTVSLYHKWDLTTDWWTGINPDEAIWEEQLADGTTLYCFINPQDKTFSAKAVWDEAVITIYADDGIPYEDVLAAIYIPQDIVYPGTPVATPMSLPIVGTVEQSTTDLKSFDVAQEQTGRAFLQITNDAFSLEDLVLYEQGVAGNMLSASYCTKDRLYIALQQEWDFSGSPWMELDTGKTWEEPLQDGETILHCYIDTADNNKFTAIGVWRDSMITIYVDSSIPYEDVLAAISLP